MSNDLKHEINRENNKQIINDVQDEIQDTSTIEHIVLSGGAYLGLYELGCLKYLSDTKYYSIKDVKSIHGTSIGGLIGAVLCLKLDWETVIEYFIKRPWHKTVVITPSMLFDIMPKKGMFDTTIINKALMPLLKCCDFDETITLRELYEYSGIDLVLYTIPINHFNDVGLSHTTYPDLPLLKAVQMTCALPYVFQPVLHEGQYYIDGGLLNNYPVKNCLEQEDANRENILSLKLDTQNPTIELQEDANLLEYGYFLYKKLIQGNRNTQERCDIHNEVVLPCEEMNLSDGYQAFTDEDERIKYIEQGKVYAKMFVSYKEKHSHTYKNNATIHTMKEEEEQDIF